MKKTYLLPFTGFSDLVKKFNKLKEALDKDNENLKTLLDKEGVDYMSIEGGFAIQLSQIVDKDEIRKLLLDGLNSDVKTNTRLMMNELGVTEKE